MKNKTVIRKERNENNLQLFVRSTPKSIIEDTRLSGNALRLLLSILGDHDENFNLSETTYCNRLKWKPTQFYRAIENLEECGYLKRKNIGKKSLRLNVKSKPVYTYIISEYGNLIKEENSSTEETTSVTETIPAEETTPTIETTSMDNNIPTNDDVEEMLKDRFNYLQNLKEEGMVISKSRFDEIFQPYLNLQLPQIIQVVNLDSFDEFYEFLQTIN